MTRGTQFKLLLAAISLLVLPVHADVTAESNYPTVEHASRLPQSLRDAPEAVTVITSEEIARWGLTDIVDIFRFVPGMRISRRGAESRVSYHGTMLTQVRRMEIMIDGSKILIGDAAYIEFRRLPISIRDIKSVTIVRGPNGSAYGDNSFLATVDFVTKGGLERSSSVAAVYGSQNTKIVTGNYAALGERFEFSLTGERSSTDGYDEYERNGEWNDLHDSPVTTRINSRLDFQVTENTKLEAAISGYRHEHQYPYRYNGSEIANGQDNEGEFYSFKSTTELSTENAVDISVSHNSQNENISFPACIPQVLFVPGAFEVALFDQDKAYELLYTGNISGEMPAALQPVIAQVKTYLATYGAALNDNRCGTIINNRDSKRSEVEALFRHLTGPWAYVIGGSGTYYDLYSQAYFGGPVYAHTSRLFSQASYAQKHVTVNAGLMAQDADYFDDSALDGRLAVSWHIDGNVTLRLTRSHSERLPSLITAKRRWSYTNHLFEPTVWGETEGHAAIVNLPPEDLQKESIDSTSIGFLGNAGLVNFDIKVFDDIIHNPIVDLLDFRGIPVENGDDYHLTGAELTVGGGWHDWRYRLAYSYLDNSSHNEFERGLQSNNQGSMTIERYLFGRHNIAVSYLWNDEISNFTYDRIDATLSLTEPFDVAGLGVRFIVRHYMGGEDGRTVGIESDYQTSAFKSLTHYFLSVDYDLP